MKKAPAYPWVFKPRFRRRAFGWKSQPAITRVKEAISEIKKVARQDKLLAAEGAVLFLERVSGALEQVDSSSGSIGNAVNRAVAELSAVIGAAPASEVQRQEWLERLWAAQQADDIPYIETLGEFWGQLCASPAMASRWADEFIGTLRTSWHVGGGYFAGTRNCLSALLKAERWDELLALLDRAPSYLQLDGMRVEILLAQGKTEQALESVMDGPGVQAAEAALLAQGDSAQAYARFALAANRKGTNLATFRAIVKKYPHVKPAQILADLVASTPGTEGKWFAAAKDFGFYAEAVQLAAATPCDPKTLTRAARDFLDKRPQFALDSGLLAIHWLLEGYGYDITAGDISQARAATMAAAARVGQESSIREKIQTMACKDSSVGQFVSRCLKP